MKGDKMTVQEKFCRFCVVWVAYLVGVFALLKLILVPTLGDVCVVVAVVIGLLAWAIGFFKWGPILGNWDSDKAKEYHS